jgi:hypothetical protein
MKSGSRRRLTHGLLLASSLALALACGEKEAGICEQIAAPPEKVGSPVELRFINDGAEAVFVREVYGCSEQWFELSQGDQLLDEGPGSCDTCEQVIDGTACGGCSVVACTGLSFVRIEPGATFTLTWPGVLYEKIAWPAECAHDPKQCGEAPPLECTAPTDAPDGQYSVRVVQAFAPSMCFGDTCECPDGADTCTLAAREYESFMDIVAPLALPQDDVLEFHLE